MAAGPIRKEGQGQGQGHSKRRRKDVAPDGVPMGSSGIRKFRRGQEQTEISAIEARLEAGAPNPGTNPLASSLSDQDVAGKDPHRLSDGRPKPFVGAKHFDQLPISERTRKGLEEAQYKVLTAIQRASLPHSLCGRDVLGAAKTGSGKTLAFVVPVLEKLYRLQWGSMDGVGAIIISPTRELAMQIFEVLRKAGKHHGFSGGLLMGGRKGVDTEKEHANSLNILVCTPGRLLQHMDETPNFDCSNLQVLVLDEADRILDLGFAKVVNAILDQLPKTRQTLLFSATQTRSVQDLARLSLKDPEYLAVHAESISATPSRLQQTAMTVPLHEKLDILWSFIKTHLQSKTLVFLSSCKQVRFYYEAFKRLRPGLPLKCLHGRMSQEKRVIVFFQFCEDKNSLLFATDVAARGLDFPEVDWVVQVDCPEDVPSYIHRVGRTARYTAGGHSILFLCPSEMKMLSELQSAKVPIKLIKANEKKVQRVSGALAGLLSKDSELKYMAQRTFITYLKSIHLRPDKEIFDVTKLPLEEYALSMGLPTTPRIRFLKNGRAEKPSVMASVLKEDKQRVKEVGSNKSENSDDDTFLTRKKMRPVVEVDSGQNGVSAGSLGTRLTKKNKLKINPNKPAGQRLVFDDEGNALPPLAAFAAQNGANGITEVGIDEKMKREAGERYKKLKEEMKGRDREDRLHEKQRLREKRWKQKRKTRDFDESASEESGYESGEEAAVKLGKSMPTNKTYFESDDSDSDHGSNYNKQSLGDGKKTEALSLDKLSVADREAMALKILSSRS